MARYLRQVGSGHIYHWTETLAKRRDMVEENLDTVERRIAALKQRKEEREAARSAAAGPGAIELQTLQAKSAELAALEAEDAEAVATKKKAEDILRNTDPSALRPDDILRTEREMTKEEIEEDEKSRKLIQDKEYQSIMVMKTKDAILGYLRESFGIEPSEKLKMEELRVMALGKRAERILEVK